MTPKKTPKTKEVTHVFQKMRPIGTFLWLTGCVRLHKDGDGFGVVMRWWHPVTWLALVLAVIPCAVFGERLLDVVPLRLSKFWMANAAQMQFVTPWTRLDSLKPFEFSLKTRNE